MQKIFYLSLLAAIIMAATACNKTDITFGDTYIDNGATQIIRTDTFGVNLSTVYTDSFITSSKGVTLVGGYTDPYFGKIQAQTFLEVAAPAYTDIYQYTSFDSISLILKLKKGTNYYGDSTQSLHIDVNQLTENILPWDNGNYLYNVDKFNYNSTPLGSTDVIVRPNFTDTIAIRLNDALGMQLFGMLQRGSDTIKTASVFLNYFKGLRLGGGINNKMILGLADSLTMRINYKKAGVITNNMQVDFKLANTSHHFTNVTADRTGTPIAALSSALHEINSTLTGNAAYTQTSTGITAKITFPSIRDILKIPNYAKLLQAVLIVRPQTSTFGPIYYLPQQMRLSTTNILNLLGPDVFVLLPNGTTSTQYGNLVTDYIYGQSTTYTYDVSTYIKSILADPTINVSNNGVLFAPPYGAYETQFSRVVLANKNNGTNSISLQITFVAIQ